MRASGRRVPSLGQLAYAPKYLSPKERGTVKFLGAVLLISLIAIGAKFSDDHLVRVAADGGDYVEVVVGVPHVINPVLSMTNDVDLDISHLVFSGLMKTDSAGKLANDLADTHDISEDGKTYAFRLKKNIFWHDGEPFTAQDVVATIERIKNPATKSPLLSQFKNVTVQATDEGTVVFSLADPFAPFLSTLTVGILPDHLWNDVLPENTGRAELNLKPIGTGPFKFRNFGKDAKGAIKSYTLGANEKFYDARPHLASITFKFANDFASAVEALQAKQVDGLSFLPLEYRDAVLSRRSVKEYTLRLPQYTAVFFNRKKNVLLDIKEVRQALALAIDREKVLAEAVKNNGSVVNGPILPGYLGFNPELKGYDFNPQAAGELLEKNGWKLDTDGFRKKTDKPAKPAKKGAAAPPPIVTPLALSITTVDTAVDSAAAEIIRQNWESIGVKTEVKIVPASKIQKETIRLRDYDVLLYGEILGADPDPFPFWHSSQNTEAGLNLGLYSNRRVDELLEKARLTLKTEEREAAYQEFQTLVHDDIPAVFLYSPGFTYVISKNIKGVDAAVIFTPADRFADATNWYINTKNAWK